jgi:Na+/proline symporter
VSWDEGSLGYITRLLTVTRVMMCLVMYSVCVGWVFLGSPRMWLARGGGYVWCIPYILIVWGMLVVFPPDVWGVFVVHIPYTH